MHWFRIFLVLIVLSCLPATAFAQTDFKDLDNSHWAYGEIHNLVEKGVIGGYDDGTVKPDHQVTRGELAKIAFTLFPDGNEINAINSPEYPDIGDHWSAPYLEVAIQLIPGYTDGYFKPSEPATRYHVAILLLYAKLLHEGNCELADGEINILLPLPEPKAWNKLKSFKEYSDLEAKYKQSTRYFEDDPDKTKFTEYAGTLFYELNNIAFLIEKNIASGYPDGSLRLKQPITRAETCALANRLYDLDLSKEDKFLIEAPALATLPNTTTPGSSHAAMVQLGQWYHWQYDQLEERARAIYNFIIYNLSYDWDHWAGLTSLPPTSLEHTLNKGTGTSVNIANMYAVLASYAGIDATVVSGQASNSTYSGTHNWVELDIGGKTLQVDPTYGVCTAKNYFNNLKEWENDGYKWTEESRRKI